MKTEILKRTKTWTKTQTMKTTMVKTMEMNKRKAKMLLMKCKEEIVLVKLRREKTKMKTLYSVKQTIFQIPPLYGSDELLGE